MSPPRPESGGPSPTTSTAASTLALGSLWSVLIGLAAGAGCSGGGAKSASDATADTMRAMDAGMTGGSAGIVGSFVVSLVEETSGTPAHAAISGAVKDRADPITAPLVPIATDGACTLSTPHLPFCATPCGSAACVADNTCASYGASQDVGTATLTGVAKQTGDPPLLLTNVNNAYLAVADQTPAYPPFAEGDDVSVQATGGAAGPFSIHAKGIAPLVLASSEALTIDKTKDFTVTWAAAGPGATSTIHLLMDLSHHGGLKGEIDCDAADAGTLTISSALVTQLLDLGVAGYPSFKLTRRSVGSTVTSLGVIDLELSQALTRYVQIPGLVSCTVDTDCPTGQTCQGDQRCK